MCENECVVAVHYRCNIRIEIHYTLIKITFITLISILQYIIKKYNITIGNKIIGEKSQKSVHHIFCPK